MVLKCRIIHEYKFRLNFVLWVLWMLQKASKNIGKICALLILSLKIIAKLVFINYFVF